ncbi:ABC transporter substrate-binding protein [Nocardiopsis changdeensis]|uniref:ABC transporter substrate-binding protein n=1 Tax=Nocardiopsis changdeensis TaxID=2831969 RepID=A0ABX8BRN1_9ACTN|nr:MULTISPECIES: ABC transporter substrate-binding protein [Nocardiopsis]QUX23924.1 ABC transporter substrate-binding protein [Nocardiopsis changdeensis]QYX39870.1 ABC transporter substrate-binding protein [Nocardiopsis sp. MT53]
MRSLRLPAALAALTLAVTACAGGGGGNGEGSGEYPRNETLYTTGTAWGPPANWNPFMQGQYAVGTVGLAYEPLFLFDPNTSEYVPWLAESDSWPEENVHEIVLREGITWTDGEAFDSADVVSTLEIGQFGSVPFSNLWNFIESVEAVDAQTVRVTFSESRPQEWMNWVYSHPIAPEHIWGEKTEEQIMSDVNEDPVGTGPYVYESHTDERLVWERNDDWWGTAALDYEMKPRYIVDLVNASNDVTLGMLQQGQVDLSNNFLPGIDQIINGNETITSFYDGPPYMQPANTAWLVPNTTKEPLNDPAFRQALAHSIDMQQIIEGPYSNLVEAANPTGLLPLWDDYIDHELVEEEGFSYDADEAVAILEDAGYQDQDGDGFVETPDGDPIALTLEVPAGWTDWMEASNVIAANAQAVGINIEAQTPEFDLLVDNRNSGEFDLIINNERQASNTPWTYYDYLFQLPINEQQTTVNFGRYENEEVWSLVEQLAAVPADDVEAAAEITSQIQEIQLAELPAIPLWYNGMWSQANNTYWTNWPSEAEGAPKSAATLWNGWWQLGAITTLATIEPAGE